MPVIVRPSAAKYAVSVALPPPSAAGFVQAPAMPPDANEEIHRHQHDFPKDVKEEEIQRHEHAQHAGLQQQHQGEESLRPAGLGQHFVNSIQNRDRTLILGTVMVYSVFLLSFNLLVDLAYLLIDPRIRYSR